MMRPFALMIFVVLLCSGCNTDDGDSFDGDVRLHYRVIDGPGTPVVVVHGGPGCDSGYLVPDLEPLFGARRLVFYDQRGGGRSELPDDDALLTMEHHVADLEALREHLGIERMTLLAHSFGPLLAASYAIAHRDRVERMILIGPLPPRRADVWQRFGAAVEAGLSEDERARMNEAFTMLSEGDDPLDGCRRFWEIAIRPRLADPESAHLLRGDLCAAPAEAIRFGMTRTNPATLASLGDWDLRAALSSVDAPTLVIHGEAEAIPMDLVEEWTTALPDARLMRIPDAAHFPYVERGDLVWPAITGFLDGYWPEEPDPELDEETLEELRGLGYIQ